MCYNGKYKKKQYREMEQIYESLSKSGLFTETRKHEVVIVSMRPTERDAEYVP